MAVSKWDLFLLTVCQVLAEWMQRLHLYVDALRGSTGTTQTGHWGRLPGGSELLGEVCDVQELAELTRGRESSGTIIGRSRGLREGQRMEHVRN